MKIINQIIIIDDNTIDCLINRKTSSRVFKEANITTFNNSVTALDYFNNPSSGHEVFADDHVILILLDINMPVMNGFELLKKLEQTTMFSKHEILVYFLSSSSHKTDLNNALSIKSCSGYLEKPLTNEKLINAINTKNNNGFYLLNNGISVRTNKSKGVA